VTFFAALFSGEKAAFSLAGPMMIVQKQKRPKNLYSKAEFKNFLQTQNYYGRRWKKNFVLASSKQTVHSHNHY